MTDPRYSWVVRNGDDELWMLLSYRWRSRRDVLRDTAHWFHHWDQVKPVEVFDDGSWEEIEQEPAPEPCRSGGGGSGGYVGIAKETTYGTYVVPFDFWTRAEPLTPVLSGRWAANLWEQSQNTPRNNAYTPGVRL